VLAAAALLQVFACSSIDAEGSCGGPDEEFGAFAAVHGPPGTEYEDQSLLAVNLCEHWPSALLSTPWCNYCTSP
jgi:hypothetical protein